MTQTNIGKYEVCIYDKMARIFFADDNGDAVFHWVCSPQEAEHLAEVCRLIHDSINGENNDSEAMA